MNSGAISLNECDMEFDLHTPRFTQTEALAVSGLTAPTLQTWVNREHVTLSDQNPGRGRRRVYSPLDVVKLAIMRRLFDFGVDITYIKELAEDVAETLAERGEIEWHRYSMIRPKQPGIQIIGSSRSMQFDYHIGNPRDMRVSSFVEPPFPRFKERSPDPAKRFQQDKFEIDPEKRDFLATQGMHAEPVLIFPVGEVANGVILQLKAIESGGDA